MGALLLSQVALDLQLAAEREAPTAQLLELAQQVQRHFDLVKEAQIEIFKEVAAGGARSEGEVGDHNKPAAISNLAVPPAARSRIPKAHGH